MNTRIQRTFFTGHGTRSMLRLMMLAALLLLIAATIGAQDSGGVYILVEDFTSSTGYTQTSPGVSISDGQVLWNVSRSGGTQFVYRQIPAFTGDFVLLVRGQINSANNNCQVQAGVGDRPGGGVSIDFGYFGGGCPGGGYVVRGSGVLLDASEASCNFSGSWLWVQPGESYAAIMTVSGDFVQLTVSDTGTSLGSLQNFGNVYNTLYVGMQGDGDWPACSGTIDSVAVIAGDVPGLSNVSIDPLVAEGLVRDMLRQDAETILRAVAANLDDASMPWELTLTLLLGFNLGGMDFVNNVEAAFAGLPTCLPAQRSSSGSRDAAALCADQWWRASDAAWAAAEIAIERWKEIAILEGERQVAEGVAENLISILGAKAAGVAALPGHGFFALSGAVLGTIHLERLRVASVDALVKITHVWLAELGYQSALDYYNRVSGGG